MPKALIVLSVLHAPREMGPVIDELISRRWDVNILVGTGGIGNDIEHWQNNGAKIIYPPRGMGYGLKHPSGSGKGSGKAFYNAVVPSFFRPLVSTTRQFFNMLKIRVYANKVISKTRPDVLFCNNFHSCGRLDDAILMACVQREVATACLLVSPLVGKAIARPGRLYQIESGMLSGQGTHSWLGRLISRIFPSWHVSDGDSIIFMWSPDAMLAAHVAGLLATDVWHTPRLEFDRVYAYNEHSVKILADSGYPSNKVRHFGTPRLDSTIAEASDPDSWIRLGLPSSNPYLLWNIEPSWEHHYCDSATHWGRIHAIAGLLSSLGKPVVISLHPLCTFTNYEFLARDYGFHIATIGIERLYPRTSFVLSFACSTNFYALVFSKRILMYDWFGVRADPRRWNIYSQPNLEVVETIDELAIALDQLVLQCDWKNVPRIGLLPILATDKIIGDLEQLGVSRKS